MSASPESAPGAGAFGARPPGRPFRVGLLGHGTVGAAFAVLLEERADEIERFNGRRPVVSGVLTRTRGDFEEILAGADLLVELMGGIEPAREHLLTAMRSWRSLETTRREKAHQALQRIAATQALSADVRDIVTRSLA